MPRDAVQSDLHCFATSHYLDARSLAICRAVYDQVEAEAALIDQQLDLQALASAVMKAMGELKEPVAVQLLIAVRMRREEFCLADRVSKSKATPASRARDRRSGRPAALRGLTRSF